MRRKIREGTLINKYFLYYYRVNIFKSVQHFFFSYLTSSLDHNKTIVDVRISSVLQSDKHNIEIITYFWTVHTYCSMLTITVNYF